MMTDYDTQEHAKEQALARASQGGHTNKYTNLVLDILPKEDVSSIIMETNNLTGHHTFERIGAILLAHKREIHAICKQFPSMSPGHQQNRCISLDRNSNKGLCLQTNIPDPFHLLAKQLYSKNKVKLAPTGKGILETFQITSDSGKTILVASDSGCTSQLILEEAISKGLIQHIQSGTTARIQVAVLLL